MKSRSSCSTARAAPSAARAPPSSRARPLATSRGQGEARRLRQGRPAPSSSRPTTSAPPSPARTRFLSRSPSRRRRRRSALVAAARRRRSRRRRTTARPRCVGAGDHEPAVRRGGGALAGRDGAGEDNRGARSVESRVSPIGARAGEVSAQLAHAWGSSRRSPAASSSETSNPAPSRRPACRSPIADEGALRVEAAVEESHAAEVKLGDPVRSRRRAPCADHRERRRSSRASTPPRAPSSSRSTSRPRP